MDDNRVLLSPRWREMLGLEEEDAEQPSSDATAGAWLSRVHPSDLRGLQDAIAAHLDGLTNRLEFLHDLHEFDSPPGCTSVSHEGSVQPLTIASNEFAAHLGQSAPNGWVGQNRGDQLLHRLLENRIGPDLTSHFATRLPHGRLLLLSCRLQMIEYIALELGLIP